MTNLTVFVVTTEAKARPILGARVIVRDPGSVEAAAQKQGGTSAQANMTQTKPGEAPPGTKAGTTKTRGRAQKKQGRSATGGRIYAEGWADEEGRIDFLDLEPGAYDVVAYAFGVEVTKYVSLAEAGTEIETLPLELSFRVEARNAASETIASCRAGDIITLEAIVDGGTAKSYLWLLNEGDLQEGDTTQQHVHWDTIGAAGNQALEVTFGDTGRAEFTAEMTFMVRAQPPTRIAPTGPLPVALTRAGLDPTNDQVLWSAIRTAENRISFRRYTEFINRVLCEPEDLSNRFGGITSGGARKLTRQRNELLAPVYGMGAYELLKTATEVFLLLNSGVFFNSADKDLNFDEKDEASRNGRFLTLAQASAELAVYMGGTAQLPYIQRVLLAVFPDCGDENTIFCGGFLEDRLENTLLMELIWTYWHKEAMVSQAMKAISLRFQNRRRSDGLDDPLAHLEIAPLHPLNNLLWGYIQDEPHRLSERRIAHELMHQYGLAHTFSDLRPAETRSKFLGAFQHLLIQTMQFYRQDDDTTVNADAFPLLNALREVHLLLAEGNHNQSFDLTVTSRAEMLIEMWMLARRELREFLQSRAMVPYREPWMGAVDAMKRLQGWTDVSVAHFNELAVYEEKVLLSIRYGDWVDVNNPVQAANWARSWRPEILSIVHAIRAVTGLELRADLTSQQQGLLSTQPSILIYRRPPNTVSMPALPPGQSAADGLPRFRERRALRRQLRP